MFLPRVGSPSYGYRIETGLTVQLMKPALERLLQLVAICVVGGIGYYLGTLSARRELNAHVQKCSSYAPTDSCWIASRLATGDREYRIGDMVSVNRDGTGGANAEFVAAFKRAGAAGNDIIHQFNRQLTRHENSTGFSLASTYLKATKEGMNISLLSRLADEQHTRTCAVHLRVGDVLETHSDGMDTSGILARGTKYLRPLSFHREQLRRMKRMGVRVVILVAWS